MKRAYISGGITNHPNYRKDFEMGCEIARMRGYKPVSPVTDLRMPYWCYMVRAVAMELTCPVVLFLRTWTASRGARIEHLIADLLNKEIYYL